MTVAVNTTNGCLICSDDIVAVFLSAHSFTAAMFGLENVVCWPRDNYEEEEHHHYSPVSLAFWTPTVMLYDSGHTRESMFKDVQPEYIPTLKAPAIYPQPKMACGPTITMPLHLQQFHGCCDAPLRRKLPVLKDWANALRARHVKGVVHGNLTWESVDVVRGTGVVLNQKPPPVRQWGEPPLDEDLSGVRWAATELFRIDNPGPHPTTMSDVYSFACLMLQLLTGRVPYCATKQLEQVVYLKYLGREPIDPKTPKVADRYVAFMRWCWSSEPRKRPTMDTVVGFVHDEIERLGDQHE